MRIKNLPSIESMDGSQDALIIEQTDGSEDKSRKVSPAQIKQYVLNDMDEVPTQNSNNPVKSGGIFSTMAVPKYDATNRREYYEGGSAFSGNIDSSPTAGSNNAVSSGGTKTYVDNKLTVKQYAPDDLYSVSADAFATHSYTLNDAQLQVVAGVAITNNGNVVLMQSYFSSTNVLTVRVRNVTSGTQTYRIIVKYL